MASRRIRPLAMALSLAALPACNPYQNFEGEYYAGPIDPTNFAAPYVGTLPGTADQSGGEIDPSTATVKGAPVSYYMFPFGSAEGTTDSMDPLDVAVAADAYVFDPTQSSAFPSPSKCKAPDHYVFDQRTESYRHDEQGVIFTSLPSSDGYVPVVNEVPVASNGEACQSVLSKSGVTSKRSDITVPSAADGKLLALAVIDPGVNIVGPDLDMPGLGPMRIGFYNHYLVGYVEGGYIPTVDVPEDTANMIPAHTDYKTQELFAPDTIPVTMTDPMTMMDVTMPGMGGLGTGYDILQAARGDADYSPVCHVNIYTPDDPLHPPASIDDLSPAELASAMDGGFVYCFQVE
jgi:hypothetical protein